MISKDISLQTQKYLVLAAFARGERLPSTDSACALDYLSTLGRRPEAQLERKGGVAFIEIGKCRVVQHPLDVEWLSHIEREAPKLGDDEGLVRICLPDEAHTDPTLKFHFSGSGKLKTVSLISSLHWRIRGHSAFVNPDPEMPGGLVIGFRLYPGSKNVTVGEYQGKYVLMNGYHRACALYKAGHRNIPVELKHSDDKEVLSMVEKELVTSEIVLSDRAPIVEDYFSPAAVLVEKKRLKNIITFSALHQKLSIDDEVREQRPSGQ